MAKTSDRGKLFTLFLIVFIDLLGFGTVIPILPYYALRYGATGSDIGWLMACYSGMQLFCAPFWGRLSDRYGRRPVLLATVLGTAISYLYLGFAGALAQLFIGRLFAGFFGANISVAYATMSDITTPENRTKGMGLLGAAFGLGFTIGPAIGGLLSQYGLSVPMFFSAGLAVFNLALCHFTLKGIGKKEIQSPRTISVLEILKKRKSFIPIATFFLFTIAITQMETVFALFFLARFGMGATQVGLLMAFFGLIMVIIQGGLIGRLTKAFKEIKLIWFGLAAAALGLAVLGFHPTHALALVGLFALSIGRALVHPCLTGLTSQSATAGNQGAVMGVFQSSASLGRVIGPPIAGLLFDRLHSGAPFLFASAMTAFALVFLAVGHKPRE